MNWRDIIFHCSIVGVASLASIQNSWAQDDDWLTGDEGTEDKRSDEEEEDIDLEADPDEQKIEQSEKATEDGGLNLGDEYDDLQIRGEGEDDADIYRKFKSELERLGPAEEAIEWQGYLDKYPKSIFRPAIEERIETLEAELYDERIEDRYRNEGGDGTAEIKLVQPLLLSNIDPRQKFHAAFEMGLPSYFNITLDYEHQLKRELSVHGGLRQSYLGWGFEPGVKYAFLKSARLQMLGTANLDFVFGANLAIRPTVGVGKKFDLPDGMMLQAMAQLGSEVVWSPSFDPRLQGGFQVVFAPTTTVNFFVETMAYMKDLTWEQGDAFAFNTFTFGLKFFDKRSVQNPQYEAGMGASMPYYYKYWRQHYGAVMGDVNIYFDQ